MDIGGLWKWSISLCGSSMKGTWRENSLLETTKGIPSKALEMGVCFHRGPRFGETWRDAPFLRFSREGEKNSFFIRRNFVEEFERHVKEGCGNGQISP